MGVELVVTPQELWTFGTQQRVQRGTPLILVAGVTANVGANRFSTLRRSGAGAGYVVTAGKTLLILRVRWRSDAAARSFGLGYADNDVGQSAAGPPTTPVYLQNAAADTYSAFIATAANTHYDIAAYYEVPAGKYPFVGLLPGTETQYFDVQAVEV